MIKNWWWCADGMLHLSPEDYLVMNHMISQEFTTLCGLTTNWSVNGKNGRACFRCLVEARALGVSL